MALMKHRARPTPKSPAVFCASPTSMTAPFNALIAARRPYGAKSAKFC